MGFATYNDIINALSGGKGQNYFWFKTCVTSPGAAAIMMRLWNMAGWPPAGADPTPALSGIVPTSATAGAIPYTNPTSPATMHLLNVGGCCTLQALIFLYDRLWHAGGVNLNSASLQTITDAQAPTRHSDGLGNMLLVEITAAAGATTKDLTINYTNTADASKSVTVNIPASSIINRVILVSLAAGDKGVKSVQSVQMSGTMGGGVANLVMYNISELLQVPCLANLYADRDLVIQVPNMPRLYDGACLSMMFLSSATGANQFLFGRVMMAEN